MANQMSTHMQAALTTLVAANNGYQSPSVIQTQMRTTDGAKTITGITKAADGEVTTSAAHGYATGDIVWIDGGDMVELTAGWYTIAVTAADTFTLTVATSGYTTYTTGGLAELYKAAPDMWTRFAAAAKTLYDAGTWLKGPSQFGDYPSYKL